MRNVTMPPRYTIDFMGGSLGAEVSLLKKADDVTLTGLGTAGWSAIRTFARGLLASLRKTSG